MATTSTTSNTTQSQVKAPVPIVDFYNPSNLKTAHEIDTALREYGFVYLAHHRIPQSTIQEAFSWSQKFFSLPQEVKTLAPHPPSGSHHRGYSGVGTEKVSQHVFDREEIGKMRDEAPDVKESYEIGHESDDEQPNIWINDEELPGFRFFMQVFYHECTRLVHEVLDCLGLALDLPDGEQDMLSKAHSRNWFQLRLLHYPSLPEVSLREGKRKRISAHSDFGSITLLFQDLVGGLEIEDPKHQGVFRKVEPREDCVLVNVGDLLERWSNGKWRSTVHRVGLPPSLFVADNEKIETSEDAKVDQRKQMTAARYSIPFFAAPDAETIIDALPGCSGSNNSKKWEPVTAGEYINMRLQALY